MKVIVGNQVFHSRDVNISVLITEENEFKTLKEMAAKKHDILVYPFNLFNLGNDSPDVF